jgi:hypothetical protein
MIPAHARHLSALSDYTNDHGPLLGEGEKGGQCEDDLFASEHPGSPAKSHRKSHQYLIHSLVIVLALLIVLVGSIKNLQLTEQICTKKLNAWCKVFLACFAVR